METNIYTPEEWKFQCALRFGVSTPAASGTITKEELLGLAPCTPMTSDGRINTVMDRMDVIGQRDTHQTADQLKQRFSENKYVSFWNEDEKKEVMQTLRKSLKPVEYEGGKNAIMKELVGGEYEVLKPSDDRLYTVKQHLQKNSSYLGTDANKLLEKVRTLLPSERKQTAATKTA